MSREGPGVEEARTVTIGPLVLEECAATNACPHYPRMCPCPHPWWRHYHQAEEMP